MVQAYQGHKWPDSNMEDVQWSEDADGTAGLGQEGEGSWLKEWATWGRGDGPSQLVVTWFWTGNMESQGVLVRTSWSSLLTVTYKVCLEIVFISGIFRVSRTLFQRSHIYGEFIVNELPGNDTKTELMQLWSMCWLFMTQVVTKWHGLVQPRAKVEG